MADSRSPFFCISREIRDKIYHYLFMEPATPIFEGKNKGTKYRNYLSLMYVNKKLSEEVNATLEKIKPLAIISCNIEHLGQAFTDCAIPYVSDHNAGKVRFHRLRLHVKFPTRSDGPRILNAYILLCTDIRRVCMVLRCLSLQFPHAPGQPVTSDGTEFPTMQMCVRLESSGGALMPRPEQVKLLTQMKSLNHIGSILIGGCSDKMVEAILPGHSERLPKRDSDITAIFDRINKFKKYRYVDGLDTVKIASWMNTIAARAVRAKDFKLAFKRYYSVVDFAEECMEKNPYMLTASLHFNDNIEEKINVQCLRAEIGLVESCTRLDEWEQAGMHIKVIMRGVAERSSTPNQLAATARALERRIKRKLGEARFSQLGIEEAVAGLDLGPDASEDTSGN